MRMHNAFVALKVAERTGETPTDAGVRLFGAADWFGEPDADESAPTSPDWL